MMSTIVYDNIHNLTLAFASNSKSTQGYAFGFVSMIQTSFKISLVFNVIIPYHFILCYDLLSKCQSDNANSILPLPEFLQGFHFLQF